MRRLLGLLMVVPLLLAGCIDAPGAATTAEDAGTASAAAAAEALGRVQALMADVPCEVEVGAGTSANLLPLQTLPFDGSTHGELDVLGNLMLAARYQSGGFEVVDMTDPDAKRLVGVYESEETPALDVKWLRDGSGALVGTPDGIEVVDLGDPTTPVQRAYWKFDDEGLAGSSHMLDTHVIDGVEWVFIAPNANTGVYILERAGWELTYRGSYVHPVLGGGPIGPHDMTVLDDELSGKPILYVANGFEGWLAADVSDPLAPVHLGGSLNLDPGQGYTHTIQAEKVGDRRLVATVSEVGVNAVKVYDATDLAAPVLLAEWFADKARPTLPNHNLQVLDGLLYVAYYGIGVYVFDLETLADSPPLAGTLSMAPIARFAPPNPEASSTDALAFVNVWDVIVKDGILYIGDVTEGVHTVGFGCLTPGDATQTSRG